MTDPATIADKLHQIQQRIADCETRYQRPAGSVQLLAVSKGQPGAALREAYAAGQRAFGESYVQEALGKQRELAMLDITWHYIGHIQSNKTRDIAAHFDWVHSVDRLNIAERLSQQRPADKPPLNICLQINLDNEASKSGTQLPQLTGLSQAVAQLPQLRLRGLMALPQASEDFAQQHRAFQRLREAQQQLQLQLHMQQGLALDTLSMGMSNDMEAAIAEGATLVRIGTAIFGERH